MKKKYLLLWHIRGLNNITSNEIEEFTNPSDELCTLTMHVIATQQRFRDKGAEDVILHQILPIK